MVHDIEAMIRHKIRTAELIPVGWQKDQVWQNIKWDSRTKSTPVFYYAAATFLLATCLLVYFLRKTENENSYQRIKTLEMAINNQLKSRPANQAADITMPTDCVTPLHLETLTAHPPGKNIPAKLNPIVVVPVPSDKMMAESAVLKFEGANIPQKSPELEQVTDQPTIEAIIGVIPPAHEKPSVAKLRKLRFRLHHGNDTPLDGRSAENYTAVITARIN
ncbi:hypothetical protein MEO93_26475 [Dolichospermum sp. ST_sed3]|nr:hypothetical protein [Dolichospermum sp. ST_sed3]